MVHVIEATELKACKPNGEWGKQSISIPVTFGKACWEELVIWETLWFVWQFLYERVIL